MNIKLKCSQCGKKETATKDQQNEARELGCAFSSCCHAVATVVSAMAINRNSARKRVKHRNAS